MKEVHRVNYYSSEHDIGNAIPHICFLHLMHKVDGRVQKENS